MLFKRPEVHDGVCWSKMNLDYPRVSVLMRAYNAEKYITEAVESILAQDYPGELELLISYDKGSSDNTLRAIDGQLQKKVPNRPIRLILHGRASPFRALTSSGFSNFTGQYVTFLDHDNLFPPNYVRKVVESAIDKNLQFVFTRARLVDSGGEDLKRNLFRIPNDYASLRRIVLRNYIDMNTMVIRNDRFVAIAKKLETLAGQFYDWIFEDWLIGMLALEQGEVKYLSDVEMYYRVHESNLVYSMYIGTSRNLHFSNLWRDFKTLTAFSYLYQDNLNFLERLYLFFAKLEKLAMFFVLKRLMPDSIFATVYRVFASIVQFIERRV